MHQKCKNYDKEDNAYSSAFLEECYNSIKEEEDKKKKKIGKSFYLYVAPIVGGILLIGGVIFIVLYCKKRKRLQMNKEKPKEEIVQTGESQHLNEEQYKCSYIIKEANKELKCEQQAIYRLNYSNNHLLCNADCSDLNEEIKKVKLDECNIECPICKQKVVGIHLIDICEKWKEIREVKKQYCEGKCKFCAKCFDDFYAKSTTCPNGHKLIR